MIQHLMRKYRKQILVVVIALVIGPFVVWGGYRSSGRGKSDEGEGPSIVASVGPIAISVAEYQEALRAEVQRRTRPDQDSPGYEELVNDGTAQRILDSLIDQALLRVEAGSKSVTLDHEYLIEVLKKDQTFYDDSGRFNTKMWNAWVEANEKQNWNEIYANLENSFARQILFSRVMAPARVLESELRRQFEDNNTKIQVKFVKVDPEIEPTDEQIQETYDLDPTRYQLPAKHTADYVAISLVPEKPAVIDEVAKRARDGEDFAALAKEYSEGAGKENGGDLGWIEETPNMPEQRQKMFALPVGGVSDPMAVGNAYHIYKVEEERTDEDSGLRSIKARQIVFRPQLTEEEQAARKQKAEDLLAKVKESGDLAAAAQEAGLAVQTAASFSEDTMTIEGVPPQDAYTFRTKVTAYEEGDVCELVEGRQNLYIAKVTKIDPPVVQPLENVKEEVREDTIEEIRRSPEHAERVEKLTEEVEAKAGSLQEIVEKFPEQKFEIQETKEFTRRDYLFDQGVYAQPVDIYEAVAKDEPGAFGGPIKGFRNEAYFVELVKKTPPTDEDWETKWPEEEEKLRENELMAKRAMLLQDYVNYLREARSQEIPIQRNHAAIASLLGMDKAPENAAPEETAPDAEVGADADADAGDAGADAGDADADAGDAGADAEDAGADAEAPAEAPTNE